MGEFIANHPNLITDALLPAVVAIVSAVWGFFRVTVALRLARYEKAIACLEAGVQTVYDEYVRSIKEASKDGKLTDEERRYARNLAIATAQEYAQRYGVDVAKELGKEFLAVTVEKILARFKGTVPVVSVPASSTPTVTMDLSPELSTDNNVVIPPVL